MDEMKREILTAEKARRSDHHNAANHQNTPQNSWQFHPALNLAQPGFGERRGDYDEPVGIDEIGRLVGGWIKANRGQAPS